jgi:endoglucanase
MTISLKRLVILVAGLLAGLSQAYAAGAFYVDPNSQAAQWVRKHPEDPRAQKIAEWIANVPSARWFGNWDADIGSEVGKFVSAANAARQVPIVVAYNIPGRDCDGASAGGANDEAAYRNWIDSFAHGIGEAAAIVIVEPDALAQLDCRKNPETSARRLDLLQYALTSLRSNAPEAQVYLDGGNAHWIAAQEMARRLNAAGLKEANGVALNVSNFYPTQDSVAYASSLNAELANTYGYTKAVIIDTSRNGNGSIGQWCNPQGAKLGETPRFIADSTLLAWIKGPGNSDGPCGVGPSLRAGEFSPDLAVRLIDGD